MGTWNPEIMLSEKRNIDSAIDTMERLNEELLGNLGVYAATIQDEVSTETKDMVMKIDALLKDIRERINKQTAHLEIGAIGFANTESGAADKIKNLKN